MNTKNTTAIATTDQNTGYLTETVNLAELFSEELDGLRPSFEPNQDSRRRWACL